MYALFKNLHVFFVTLSVAGFLLRGYWMMSGNPLSQHRLARRLPHVIDSLLLATALVIAVMAAQYPFVAPWLTAKVLGLLAYIVLGAVALTYGRSQGGRVAAFVGALLVFAWIVSVAITKQPAGFLAGSGGA